MLLALTLLAYPAAVFLLLEQTGPLALAAVFAAVAGLRLLLARHLSARAIIFGLAAVVTLCIATVALQSIVAVKLYPAAFSAAVAIWCAYTLSAPPSGIQRLLNTAHKSWAHLPVRARKHIPLLNPVSAESMPPSIAQLSYMRGLTQVWLGFFVVNTVIAAVTALVLSTATWALYTGIGSYLLVAVLLMAELVYRPIYQRRHEQSPKEAVVDGVG